MELALAILGALAAVIPALVTAWVNRSREGRRKEEALADVERQETDDSMARVDAEYRRLQPPGR